MSDNPIIITASPYGDIYRSGVIPMYLKSSSVVDPKAKYTVVSPEEAYKIAADIYIPQDSRLLLSAVLRMRITTVPDITRPATITVTDGVTFISSTGADIYSAISSGTVVGTVTSNDSGNIVKTITNQTALALIRDKLATPGTLMFGIYAANQHATSSTVLSRPAEGQIEQAVGLTLTLTFKDADIPINTTTVIQAEDIVTVTYAGSAYSTLSIDGTTLTDFSIAESGFGVVRGAISFIIPHDDRVIVSVSFDGEINFEVTNDPMLVTASYPANALTNYLGGETSPSQPEELCNNITSNLMGQINEGTPVGSVSFQSVSFSAYVAKAFAAPDTKRLNMGFYFANTGNGSFQAILGSRPTLTVIFQDMYVDTIVVESTATLTTSTTASLYAPIISSDIIEQSFNNGIVTINWALPKSLSEDPYIALSNFTYEIEYTENYSGPTQTLWHTLKRRIQYYSTSYEWIVGKMIKSNTVRVRIRTKSSSNEEYSDWSISGNFSINVFKLSPPEILSPIANSLYSDFILIILNENLLINTYNQKVRYTLEYYSSSQEIDWTTIAKDVIPGRGVIRWDIESLPSANDYILRLITKNVSSSCITTEDNPDQYSASYVYDINIKQSGVFIIDTKPPEAILEIGSGPLSNQLHHIVDIFAEDATTDVKSIQLRECDASSIVKLGNIDAPTEVVEDCPSPESLMSSRPFDTLITDAPIGNHSKIQWIFNELDKNGKPVSALKKIEALLTDSGGNSSLQETTKVFLSIFSSDKDINDLIVIIEERQLFNLGDDGSSTDQSFATFEVVYLGLSSGELWILEPHPRLIYTITDHPNILKLCEFNNSIYIYAYNSQQNEGALYRHDSSFYSLLNVFNGSGSNIATDMKVYDDSLYIGLRSGYLWEYNGLSFANKHIFDNPISTLYADDAYLYIGFYSSSIIYIYIYDGNTFEEVIVSYEDLDNFTINQIYTRSGNIYSIGSNGDILKGNRPIWDNEFNYLTNDEVSNLNAYDKSKVLKLNSGIKISGTSIRI